MPWTDVRASRLIVSVQDFGYSADVNATHAPAVLRANTYAQQEAERRSLQGYTLGFNDGYYHFADEDLVLGGEYGVTAPGSIHGQSRMGARLIWHDDRSGYRVRWYSTDATGPNTIRDCVITGPGDEGCDLGERPCDASGIDLPAAVILDKVSANGWNVGVNVSRDHSYLQYVEIAGCYYDVYFGQPSGGIADNGFTHCNFVGPKMASIGVSGANLIGGCTFVDIHLGYGPYCFYKEKSEGIEPDMFSGPKDLFIAGNKFVDVAFESYMNAIAGEEHHSDDSRHARVYSNVWIGSDTANPGSASGPGLPGASQDFAWQVYSLEYNRFLNSAGALDPSDVGTFDVDVLTDNVFEDCWTPGGMERWGAAGKQLAVDGFPANAAQGNRWSTAGITGDFSTAGETVELGQLLMVGPSGSEAKPYTHDGADASLNVPRGIAGFDASAGALLMVTRRGLVTALTSEGGGGKFMWAKPSTSVPGEVARATGWTDGPLVGQWMTGDNGGVCALDLRT